MTLSEIVPTTDLVSDPFLKTAPLGGLLSIRVSPWESRVPDLAFTPSPILVCLPSPLRG